MKNVIKNSVICLCALGFVLIFSACRKETVIENIDISLGDKRIGLDYAASENLFQEIFNLVDFESLKQPILNGTKDSVAVGNCPKISVSPMGNVYPKTITLDYGTGCTTRKNVAASGKVIAVFSGKPRQNGVKVSVSFQNFNYRGYTLRGTYNANYTSATGYTATITDGNITTPDGKNITYQSTITATQTEGQATTFQTNGEAGILDDVYTFTANSTGTDTGGVTYTTTTITPLVKRLDCNWISAGVVELKISGQATKKVDFGAGTCDNQATLTVGRFTTPIVLP